MDDTPPQRIKLLVIDIDGTLLNPQKEITARTLAAIQAAQQEGIIVTLATARRYYNTAPIANELGITIPLIVYDGALIVEHPSGNILHTHLLEAEIAQQAVEALVQHHVQPIVHRINGLMEETWTGPAEYDTEWVAEYFTTFGTYASACLIRVPYANCCVGRADPLRVVAFASEEVISELVEEVSALSCAWNTTRRGTYGCAEMAIMHKDCSKASGVKTLAQLLNIPLAQVMAIGDNNNDIEMLQAVGWGVAMGHAPAVVKSVANAVTASNVDDGVAQAIERYALSCPSLYTRSNSINREICR